MRRQILKAILLLLSCALFTLSISGQVTGVEEVYLARDDGKGQPGEVVSTFTPLDIPIHCIVRLDSVKIATVRMSLMAIKVPGVKPETKVVTVSFTTKANQNQVNFTGRPDKFWTPGTYRVDVFLNGKLATSHDFLIENAGGEKAPVADSGLVNTFQPKGPVKPAPRKVRKN